MTEQETEIMAELKAACETCVYEIIELLHSVPLLHQEPFVGSERSNRIRAARHLARKAVDMANDKLTQQPSITSCSTCGQKTVINGNCGCDPANEPKHAPSLKCAEDMQRRGLCADEHPQLLADFIAVQTSCDRLLESRDRLLTACKTFWEVYGRPHGLCAPRVSYVEWESVRDTVHAAIAAEAEG